MALKRLKPTNFINDLCYCADDTYIYGKSSETVFGKWSVADAVAGTTPTETTGHDFGAGFAIKGAWLLSTATLLCLVEENSTSLHTLYRSIDGGDNFSSVMDFGDTGGGQIADVLALYDGIAEVDIDGSKQVIIFEYNVNGSRVLGSTNDQVRIMSSSDDGQNFSPLITLNTDGSTHQVKHGHCVAQNPVTKEVLFGSGDSGALGTLDYGQAIFSWDGVSPWPSDNTFFTDFNEYDGFTALAEETNYRTVSFLFDNSGNIYTATDANATAELGGIWKWESDLSSGYQLDNQEAQFSNHTMWYGESIAGTHYWLDDVSSSTVTDWHYNVYASDTPWESGSYEIIGRLSGEDGVNSSPVSIFSAGGKLVISSGGLTGKSFNQTTIIDISNEQWKDQIDVVAPVVWVNPTSGSDANTGWYPDDAWQTLSKALEASAISHGTCVMLSGESTSPNFIDCDWTAYSDAGAGSGVPNAPVQIRGEGREVTSFAVTGDSDTFFFNVANQTLNIYDARVRHSGPSTADIFSLNATSCFANAYDSWLGDKGDNTRPLRPDSNGNSCKTYRTLLQGDESVICWQPGGSITGADFYAESCVFDGFKEFTFIVNDSFVNCVQCTALNGAVSSDGFDRGGTATEAPRLKNLAVSVVGAGAFPITMSSGSPVLTDKESDFNILNTATSPSGLQGSNGAIADPEIDPITYSAGSVCLAAGQSVGVKYDYYGRLFQPDRPSVGAVELNPYSVPSLTGNAGSGIMQPIMASGY